MTNQLWEVTYREPVNGGVCSVVFQGGNDPTVIVEKFVSYATRRYPFDPRPSTLTSKLREPALPRDRETVLSFIVTIQRDREIES